MEHYRKQCTLVSSSPLVEPFIPLPRPDPSASAFNSVRGFRLRGRDFRSFSFSPETISLLSLSQQRNQRRPTEEEPISFRALLPRAGVDVLCWPLTGPPPLTCLTNRPPRPRPRPAKQTSRVTGWGPPLPCPRHAPPPALARLPGLALGPWPRLLPSRGPRLGGECYSCLQKKKKFLDLV